ncbi:MAG: transcriptional repressor [Thermomicrobiales bacterium]|nr:transcriptional repressor [Thermomicrobiales bacterium]
MTASSPTISPPDQHYDDLANRLRSIGQRATPQRLLVLAAFQDAGEHLTADEIYARISERSPTVNRSTVYRTLETFRDLGVIAETDLGGGVRRYQLLDHERHHHLVCHDCGDIIDLDDDVLEPIRRAAAERYGFSAEIDHLAIFGRCQFCRGDE